MSPFHKKIFLILLGIIIALLLLEIAARLFLPKAPSIVIQNLGEKSPSTGGPIQIFGKTDNDLYYPTLTGRRAKENVKAIVRNHFLSKIDVEIDTNSQGFRYRELLPKTNSDFRILAIGDSITIEDYLPENQTYTYLLEQLLQKNVSDGKSTQVINAGAGAIGSENELAILVERGLGVKPDVVLLELYLNDAYESGAITLIKPPKITTKSALVNFIVEKINLMRAKKYQYQFIATKPKDEVSLFKESHPTQNDFNKQIVENWEDWGYAWSPKFAEKESQILSVFAELARENNFKFAVVIFPVKYQIQQETVRDEPQKALSKALEDQKIPYLDLLPPLRDKYQKDKIDLYFDHAHPNFEGNEFIAKVITGLFYKSLKYER